MIMASDVAAAGRLPQRLLVDRDAEILADLRDVLR